MNSLEEMSLFKNLNKRKVYAILIGLYCAMVIISNITATKTFKFYDFVFTCSIVVFPILFILNDVFSEIYGYRLAREAIYMGLIVNVIAVVIYQIAILFPSNGVNTHEFQVLLSTTPRLLIAGFCAYLTGNILNAYVLVTLKKFKDQWLFFRCFMSTVFGEAVDSFIFSFLGFYGLMPNTDLFLMFISLTILQIGYEVVCYPITKYIIYKIRALPN